MQRNTLCTQASYKPTPTPTPTPMQALLDLVALLSAQFALVKGFAECCTRQRPLGKKWVSKGVFADCLLSGTRQSLC